MKKTLKDALRPHPKVIPTRHKNTQTQMQANNLRRIKNTTKQIQKPIKM